jgi:hypothetical protein
MINSVLFLAGADIDISLQLPWGFIYRHTEKEMDIK